MATRATLLTTAVILMALPGPGREAGMADQEGLPLGAKTPLYEAAAGEALDLTDEVTLEAWVRADKMPDAGGRILDKSVPGTQRGYMLDTWPGNSLRFLNARGMCRFDAKLPADRWSHVAGVYSGRRCRRQWRFRRYGRHRTSRWRWW